MKYTARRDEDIHRHEFLEIVYILSGRGRHCINGTWYRVQRGNLLFINFGQTHAFCPEAEMEIVNCLINPQFVDTELINSENAMEILTLSSFQDFSMGADKLIPMLYFSGKNMLDIESLFGSMLDEFEQKLTNYKTVLKGCTLVLLTRIFRAMQDAGNGQILHHMGRITPDILQYIEDNFSEKISVQALAQKCFYNPSYFSSVFKACFGKSLTEFIVEKRLSEAQRLLAETSLSIEEICLRIGYRDRKQFYKLFKAHTGLTPSAFRNHSVK